MSPKTRQMRLSGLEEGVEGEEQGASPPEKTNGGEGQGKMEMILSNGVEDYCYCCCAREMMRNFHSLEMNDRV